MKTLRFSNFSAFTSRYSLRINFSFATSSDCLFLQNVCHSLFLWSKFIHSSTCPKINYFNRINISNEKTKLYCQRHQSFNFIIYLEIEVLIRKLIDFFGADTYNKIYYDYDLRKGMDIESKYIREWNYEDLLDQAQKLGGMLSSFIFA